MRTRYFYGFAHGGSFPVMSPMIAEFIGTGSHGCCSAWPWPSGTLGGAAAGPLMAGRAFDVTGSYRIAFLLVTMLAMIGFVLNFYFPIKFFQFLPIYRPILGAISTKGVR